MANKKILIVDDEPDMADFLKTALESDGYAVESAGSGQAVLDVLKKGPVDLILLDMGIPGVHPATPAEDVRKRSRTKAPILIMTGRDVLKEEKDGHLRGSDGALQKGAGMESILKKVKELLPK